MQVGLPQVVGAMPCARRSMGAPATCASSSCSPGPVSALRCGPLRPKSAQSLFVRPATRNTSQQQQQGRGRQGVRVQASAASIALPADDSFERASNPGGFKGFLARLRALAFYVTTLVLSLPLFCVMLAVYPFVMLFDSHRRQAEHFVNFVWAKLTMLPFAPVTVEGAENLPPVTTPAVYVANHLSYLDIFTLFHLNRPFKFVSKTSNFFIPIIGWSMFLTGHIMLNRVDKKSQIQLLKHCGVVLQEGASVLFFPEGTRSKDGCMHEFKKGAFSVAARNKVPVVPVTLVNTGDMMPNGKEYLLNAGHVHMVVHEPIPPSDADTMMQQARKAIASSLPPGRVADK